MNCNSVKQYLRKYALLSLGEEASVAKNLQAQLSPRFLRRNVQIFEEHDVCGGCCS